MLDGHPEGLAPSAMADRAGVTRGTITGLLDGLERDGFVRRAPDPEDRRALLVHLTEAGKGRVQTLLGEHAQWIDGLFASFSAAERRQLSRLLVKLWSATGDGRTKPGPYLEGRRD